MSLFKLWTIVILSVATFDFALPFACAWWAQSIFESESKNEITIVQQGQSEGMLIPEKLHISKVQQEENPWSEIEIDEEETIANYYDAISGTTTFTYTEKFIIPSEYRDSKKAALDLLQAKVLNGNKFISEKGFISSGVRDISYYTNPRNNTKYVKIIYAIEDNFSGTRF